MDISNITVKDIITFLKDNVPFDELVKNKGIYETDLIKNTSITIGVSYEDLKTDDGKDTYDGYHYNVFADGEYIYWRNK